jgi:hypothetical protein
MTDKIIVQGEINDDGQLVVQLPPDAPRGAVQITIEQTAELQEDDFDAELDALIDESLNSKGMTMGEIKLPDEPILGEDFPDGKTYVEQLRSKRRYKW